MKSVCMKLILAGFSFLILSDASAECISPILTPVECQFKREDSHLTVLQPAWYFNKEDKVDELIEQGESFIENYYATVKTTGDLAIRAQIPPAIYAMTIVEVTEAITIVQLLANDPWNLKDIFTDVLCDLYFDTVEPVFEALPNITVDLEYDCPATNELLTDIHKLQRLDDVRQRMTDILTNPDILLGEQWTGVIDDIRTMRDELDSLDTFARNIWYEDVRVRYAELYPNFDALMAAPNETLRQLNARIERLTDSKRNTIRDTVMSTRQNHLRMKDDLDELMELSSKSKRAVGQMQSVEIENMLDTQSVQAFMGIKEETLNMGGLFIQNYADRHGDATRRKAYTTKSAEPIEFHEAQLGGEVFLQ